MKQEEIKVLAKSIKAEFQETHISWVLLTKKYAYKIKKPIKTSFLDFSTLKKREKICLKELELNQVLSPKVYKEVVGIKKDHSEFSFVSAKEKCFEYSVKMKRLDSKKQMNKMLLNGEVKEKHIRRLAKKITGFHSKTKVSNLVKRKEERAKEFSDLLSLKEEFVHGLGKETFLNIQEVVRREKRFLKEYEHYFIERAAAGFVKDCHGDLHSGNIFLYRSPILFDRIEFNDRFRFIDVLHEVGFLCMDLEASGNFKLSEKFLSYYLKFSGQVLSRQEKALLNYFKCYTANVRAKVILMKSTKDRKDYKTIKKYLGLMVKYAYEKL